MVEYLDAIANLFFFIVGSLTGWFLQRRAGSAADADIYQLLSDLAREADRSFAGSERDALSIAHNTRALLEHYVTASKGQRQVIIYGIQNAYTSLAFGTFARASELSNKMLKDLQLGMQSVYEELGRVAQRDGEKLLDLADHLFFVGEIGREMRRAGSHVISTNNSEVVEIWGERDSDTKSSGRSRRKRRTTKKSETQIRLERLRVLYAEELTVIKDWDLLISRSADLVVSASVLPIAQTSSWRAPWYLSDAEPDGRLRSVNVLNEPLGENDPGYGYEHQPNPLLPVYPSSIVHGKVPPGLRSYPIEKLRQLFGQQSPPVICALVYEVVLDGDGRTLVLDGNHRIAAARKIIEEQAGPLSAANQRLRPFVLEFRISEKCVIDDVASHEDAKGNRWEWRGFTPDVQLVRADGSEPTRTSPV